LPLIESRTLATLVLLTIGLFALEINSRPITPGRRVLIATMGALFLFVLSSATWREFFELDVPPLVVLLAGVGIVGMTGFVLYGALTALGWVKAVPELLGEDLRNQGAWGMVRSGIDRARERAQRIGQPIDPSMLEDEDPDPPPPRAREMD
jgi:hypothetical protein